MNKPDVAQTNDHPSTAHNMRIESASAYTPESREIFKLATINRNQPATCVPDVSIVDSLEDKK